MRQANIFTISLAMLGLCGWSVAFGQEAEEMGPGQQIDAGADQDVDVDVDVQGQDLIEEGDRMAEQPGAATQPAGQARQQFSWQNQQGQQDRQQRQRGQQDEQARRQAQQRDVDIFVFGDIDESEPQSYWQSPGQQGQGQFGGQQFGGQQQGIYGFAGDDRGAWQRSSGVGGVVAHPVPTEADKHSWGDGMNLVDYNLIQTRDSFDNPDDFYTKEWLVSQPPIVAHQRFHTIYDSDLTSQYYSAWHGSPVNWAANRMVKTTLPEPDDELHSDKQLVTYFTPFIENGNTTDTPDTFATGTTGRYAGTWYESDVYGYRGDTNYGYATPRGRMDRDGTVKVNGQSFYWDDQDLMDGQGQGMWTGSNIYGYVSPGSRIIDSGEVSDDAELHLNVPRSTGVNIFGVPTGTDESEMADRQAEDVETDYVYGYEGTDEDEVEYEKDDDHECEDHDDDDRDKVIIKGQDIEVEHE